jgi:hypothetical protein
MVKFLLQHALALDEKADEEDLRPARQSVESPSHVFAMSERGRFTAHALSGLLLDH